MTTRADRSEPPADGLRLAALAAKPAANDDGGVPHPAVRTERGWDPYEIWASRVRDARLAAPRAR